MCSQQGGSVGLQIIILTVVNDSFFRWSWMYKCRWHGYATRQLFLSWSSFIFHVYLSSFPVGNSHQVKGVFYISYSNPTRNIDKVIRQLKNAKTFCLFCGVVLLFLQTLNNKIYLEGLKWYFVRKPKRKQFVCSLLLNSGLGLHKALARTFLRLFFWTCFPRSPQQSFSLPSYYQYRFLSQHASLPTLRSLCPLNGFFRFRNAANWEEDERT